MLLDILIPLTFAGYGIAMLLRLSRGEDSLPHSRLESGSMPLLVWRIVAASLVASAACDVLIAYNLSVGKIGILLWVPSIVSSLSMLSLGAISLSHAIESRRDNTSDRTEFNDGDAERDQAIIARLDDYVQIQKPFLDPDLTLARLGKKLVIPAKQISSAINRVKGGTKVGMLTYNTGFIFFQTSRAAALGILLVALVSPVYWLWRRAQRSGA